MFLHQSNGGMIMWTSFKVVMTGFKNELKKTFLFY